MNVGVQSCSGFFAWLMHRAITPNIITWKNTWHDHLMSRAATHTWQHMISHTSTQACVCPHTITSILQGKLLGNLVLSLFCWFAFAVTFQFLFVGFQLLDSFSHNFNAMSWLIDCHGCVCVCELVDFAVHTFLSGCVWEMKKDWQPCHHRKSFPFCDRLNKQQCQKFPA